MTIKSKRQPPWSNFDPNPPREERQTEYPRHANFIPAPEPKDDTTPKRGPGRPRKKPVSTEE